MKNICKWLLLLRVDFDVDKINRFFLQLNEKRRIFLNLMQDEWQLEQHLQIEYLTYVLDDAMPREIVVLKGEASVKQTR